MTLDADELKNDSQSLDRLDGNSEWDGYCEHGVYVGGCGIDWMCPECEWDE